MRRARREAFGGDEPGWRERFTTRLADPAGAIFVATERGSGDILGYGRVQHQSSDAISAQGLLPAGCYLAGIVVHPESRRLGLGLALCQVRIAWTAERASSVWYFTNVRNRASRNLHGRAGFVEVGVFASDELDGGRGMLGHRLLPSTSVAAAESQVAVSRSTRTSA